MEIEKIAKLILASGKGILAADESTGTMTKRLDAVGIPSTPQNRLTFREMMFTSNEAKKYISGVILYDETIRQKTSSGISIPELLRAQNIIPGIKVDSGLKSLAGSPEETTTEGLNGLRERLNEYYKLGARFTKWRGVYKISKIFPSESAIVANAHSLARYAALVQEANMVPIIEPEVLMDGKHDIQKCFDVTSRVLHECFHQLKIAKVKLEGIILKPNMILNGSESGIKNENETVAKKTLECLKNNVPEEVPGIAFLSGGQTELEATRNLNAINKINDTEFVFTFSYGRALQQSALKKWAEDINNTSKAQNEFNIRALMNSLASKGEWNEAKEIAA